jgi:hypothetical protein
MLQKHRSRSTYTSRSNRRYPQVNENEGIRGQDKCRFDLRLSLLLPTDKLRKAMNEHLVRTLNEARRALGTSLAE